MKTATTNMYVFTALEAYPYELTKAVEALNYALSAEPDNVQALFLMAQVHSEQLGEFQAAKNYFEAALVHGLDLPKIYPSYIHALLRNQDFEEAQKVIDFALTVRGIDKASILLAQGNLYEHLEQFDKAEAVLEEAKYEAMNSGFMQYVDEELERITKKRHMQFNKQKTELQPSETDAVSEVEGKPKNWFVNRLNSLL